MSKMREFWMTCFIREGWNWSIKDENPNYNTYPDDNDYEKYKDKYYQIHVREVSPEYDKAVQGLADALETFKSYGDYIDGESNVAGKALAAFEAVK